MLRILPAFWTYNRRDPGTPSQKWLFAVGTTHGQLVPNKRRKAQKSMKTSRSCRGRTTTRSNNRKTRALKSRTCRVIHKSHCHPWIPKPAVYERGETLILQDFPSIRSTLGIPENLFRYSLPNESKDPWWKKEKIAQIRRESYKSTNAALIRGARCIYSSAEIWSGCEQTLLRAQKPDPSAAQRKVSLLRGFAHCFRDQWTS